MAEANGGVRPLDGVRVIEISSFIAGPYCAAQLAEFGAEIIKMELPGIGDALRKFGTMTDCGDSLPWLSECRNKKCGTLDLRKPEGAELLKQLVAKADVLIENFQPGTLEKWGLGWDVLSAVNPRLVMVRISGYGQTGPYSSRPGFGRIGNAFGGLSYLAGYPDRPPVTPGSATIPDYLAGLYGSQGVLLALRAREMTGRGQVVDIGLYESVFRILDELAPAFHHGGYVRQRMGPAPSTSCPTAIIRPATGVGSPSPAPTTRSSPGSPKPWNGPTSPRPEAGAGSRRARRDRAAVDEAVGAWTSTLTRDDAIARCAEFQVPCGPVYAIDEIFEDPHYRARGNIAFVEDERAGEIAVPAPVPRLTDTPGRIDHLGPALGADNAEIYETLLGLSKTRIAELSAAGVV